HERLFLRQTELPAFLIVREIFGPGCPAPPRFRTERRAGPLFHSISVFGRRTACTQHPDASSRTHRWGYASTPRRAACRTASIRSDWGSRNNERVVRTTLAARVYVSYPYFHPTVVHQPRNRRRSIRDVRPRLVRRE